MSGRARRAPGGFLPAVELHDRAVWDPVYGLVPGPCTLRDIGSGREIAAREPTSVRGALILPAERAATTRPARA